MPTAKEVLTGLLSSAYQIDENGVAELLKPDGSEEFKDDALQVLLSKDAQRITALKPDTKKFFDDGYKKGQSESLSKFEKETKAKFGLQSDKQGIELLEDLVAQFKEENPDDPEKIKKSKFYIDAVEDFNKKSGELKTTYEKQLEDFKKQVERKELFGNVSSQALIIFENLKPILPTDAGKAANLKQVFINELSSLNYDVRDGNVVLLDKEGNDLVDGHGNRIKFDSLVKATAEKYFEFYQSDDKNAPNHKQNKGNAGSSVFKINSQADFIKYMNEVKDEDKPALMAAYREAKEAGRL